MRLHRIRILSESGQAAATMIAFWRKGIAQQAIYALPGRQHLRALYFVGQPPLRVDDFTRRDVDAEIAR